MGHLLNTLVAPQPRMKVKILVGRAGSDFVWQQGAVLDLPPADAQFYIDRGEAELVEEPEQRKVTVQRVKKATKRPVIKVTKR